MCKIIRDSPESSDLGKQTNITPLEDGDEPTVHLGCFIKIERLDLKFTKSDVDVG